MAAVRQYEMKVNMTLPTMITLAACRTRLLPPGGSDDPGNQISLCAAHHLHGVHMGWIRVSGTAPDGLRWELGVGAAA